MKLTGYALALAVVLGLMALLASGTVRADSTATLDVAGTFSNGDTLSGTVTLDTTTGTVESVSLSSSSMPDTLFTTYFVSPQAYDDILIATYSPVISEEIGLEIPTDDLVGYTGGPLCSLSDPCGAINYNEDSNEYNPEFFFLQQGSLTPTPEPSSLLLFGTGIALICMATLVRRWMRVARARAA
jgi:hypothetical protein